MKTLLGLSIAIFLAGCAIPVKIVQEAGPISPDAIKQLGDHLNKSVVVTVGDEDYACVLLAADQDKIKVSSQEEMREIPLNAIRSVRPDRGVLAGSGRIAGLVVGGATGALLGEAIADKAGVRTDGKKGTQTRVAGAIGGAILGVLAVKAFGSNDGVIIVNTRLKPTTLDKAVGTTLSATEMQAYGIFTDLPLKAGEILLKAKVFLCEAGQYLVVYETHNGDVNGLSWECVDEEYVKQQKDKIRALKQAKNIGMDD
jgi:hypothetical protein